MSQPPLIRNASTRVCNTMNSDLAKKQSQLFPYSSTRVNTRLYPNYAHTPLFRNSSTYRMTPNHGRVQARPSTRLIKTPFKIPSTSVTCRVKKTISSPNNSLDRCTPPACIGLRCEKSLSMNDLSHVSIQRDKVDGRLAEGVGDGVHVTETGTKMRSLINHSENGTGSSDEKKAAHVVCHALMMNAWRRRRDDNARFRDTTRQLSEQVGHLRIQIVVLRRLLETENSRTAKCMTELHQVRTKQEKSSRELDALKQENDVAVQDAKKYKDTSETKTIEAENLRNELLTAKTQLQSLDAQIAKDREKLLKLREDKKLLLEKVTKSEALAAERATKAASAEAAVQNLQTRLDAQVALLATAHEYQRQCSKAMKTKDDEAIKMHKQLQACKEVRKQLTLRTSNLETALSARESALRSLESSYHSQLLELNELRERLIRQSQEVGWGSRILKLAGSIVQAPRMMLSLLSNSVSTAPS